MIGEPPNVAVPTHFYKVMLVENLETYLFLSIVIFLSKEFMIGSFMVPNAPIPENTPIESFVVPLEVIERNSGLTFFNRIPRFFKWIWKLIFRMAMMPLCTQTKCILPPAHPAAKKPVGALAPPPPTLQLPPSTTLQLPPPTSTK